MAKQGFSLIELTVVVVILALMSVLGLTTFSAQLDEARLRRTVSNLVDADAHERAAARRSPLSGSLVSDAKHGRLVFALSGRTLRLDRSMKLSDFQTTAPDDRVVFAPTGQSHSYALKLRTSGGREQWWVILGATGQLVAAENRSDVQSLLRIAP